MLPLLHSGFPWNHDKELYMVWLSEFDVGIKDGQFLPRWVPDVWVGYGSPLFNFNQPLFYYIAELFHLIGISLLASVKLTLIIITALGFWFMYLLARQFFESRGALISAVIYSLSSYHLGLIYSRGALSEYLAMCLLPLLFFLFYRLRRISSLKYFFWCALVVALLLLSHNISTILYLPLLTVFILIFGKRKFSSYLLSLGSIVVGFLLSAWFWLPAFAERQYLKIDNLYSGPYDYHNNFTSLGNLFYSNFMDNTAVFYQVSFVASLIIVITVVALFVHWQKDVQKSRMVLFFLVISLLSVFMTNAASLIIWENVPLMEYLQFPWRWLSVVNFGLAICAGVVAWPFMQRAFAWIYKKINSKAEYRYPVVTPVIIILLLFFFSPSLGPSGGYLPQKTDEQYTPHQQIVDQLHESTTLNTFVYKTAIFPRDNDLDKLEERANNTVRDLYDHMLNNQEFFYQSVELLSGQAMITETNSTSVREEYEIDSVGESKIMINTFWFPGWQAELDGQATSISVNEDYGLMEFTIPAGVHSLVIEFKNTTIRTIANIVSSVALVIYVLFGLYLIIKRKTHSPDEKILA